MAHFDELDKYGLKGTEWRQLPVDNPEHDFITPLLGNYLEDLNERKNLSTHGKPKFVDLLRKQMKIGDMSDIIMTEHAKTQQLKEAAAAREAQLEGIRQLKERDERLNLRIRTKFDFKRKNVTKRSNSCVP